MVCQSNTTGLVLLDEAASAAAPGWECKASPVVAPSDFDRLVSEPTALPHSRRRHSSIGWGIPATTTTAVPPTVPPCGPPRVIDG